MNNFELDRELRETLHECAEPVHADERLKSKIDHRIAQPAKKRHFSRRLAIGLAAAVCLTVGGALARGTVTGLVTSSNRNDALTSISELRKEAATVSGDIILPDKVGGYSFSEGDVRFTDKMDETGNVLESFPEVDAYYDTKGDNLTWNARVWDSELDSEGSAWSIQKELSGVTVSYQTDRYLFLPPDEEPTAEETAQMDRGELYISYGSQTREEQQFQNIGWQIGDIVYSIYTTDNSITPDALFDAVGEILAAR